MPNIKIEKIDMLTNVLVQKENVYFFNIRVN